MRGRHSLKEFKELLQVVGVIKRQRLTILVLSTKPKANSEGQERRGLQRLVQQGMQEVEKQQVSKKVQIRRSSGRREESTERCEAVVLLVTLLLLC